MQMKDIRYKIIGLAIATFLLFGLCVKPANSETSLGDICWRVDVTSPWVDSWTYRLGVSLMDGGGGHYTVNGTEGDYGVVHGNIEIIDNNAEIPILFFVSVALA